MRFTSRVFSHQTPSHVPWLTVFFVIATVMTYLWQVQVFGHYLAFSDSELRRLGANSSTLTFAGEYWRLFSYFFLHASLQDLVISVTGLSIIGAALERCVRWWQWLLLYVCGGAFAGLAVDYWYSDPGSFRLYVDGASMSVAFQRVGGEGAIASLAAGLAAVVYWADLRGTQRLFDSAWTVRLLKASAVFMLLTLMFTVCDRGADHSAYLSGTAFGLLMGTVLVAFSGSISRTAGLLPIIAVVLACVLVLCMTRNTVKHGAVRGHYVEQRHTDDARPARR